jgi:tetratricopeptide (TPR) repeat protein
LVEDVKGHALTLNLVGGFLKRAFLGDIRQRHRVNFEKADEKIEGGHAFRTMAAYERWLLSGGDSGRRELAVLRLIGLFDRTAASSDLKALRCEPVIIGLTEPLVNVSEEDWNCTLTSLSDCGLISIQNDRLAVDSHPLLREYFARQIGTKQPFAWRAAHQRLYEHLCATTPEKPDPTLEDLQPLYQAVAHGCQARSYQDASDLYFKRILQGVKHYTWHKLGAYSSELAIQACFFEVPWTKTVSLLQPHDQNWFLNEAAFCLRALGRLTEAVQPARAALEGYLELADWPNAAQACENLAVLKLSLGQLPDALKEAEQSVIYADHSRDPDKCILLRTTQAYTLFQLGRWAEARILFDEAEQIQKDHQPEFPLYFVQGFLYCDLLICQAERAAWRGVLKCREKSSHVKTLRAVYQRATQTLKIAELTGLSLVFVALNNITLSRIALYDSVLSERASRKRNSGFKISIDEGVNGLHRSGDAVYLPHGHLTRAWLRFLSGARIGSVSSQEDLDEAWEIAERGPMKLHMADIHLYRARLFFKEPKYPWESPRKDLEEAERLINECGYHRRDEELADAKRVILGQSV